MSLEENRDCNYNNTMEIQEITNIENLNGYSDRDEMLEQIKNYNFAITELALYLDTHPDDEKALCLHKKYAKILKDLKDKFQKVYGPLSIYCPCNKWRWLEETWPWEGGMY